MNAFMIPCLCNRVKVKLSWCTMSTSPFRAIIWCVYTNNMLQAFWSNTFKSQRHVQRETS